MADYVYRGSERPRILKGPLKAVYG